MDHRLNTNGPCLICHKKTLLTTSFRAWHRRTTEVGALALNSSSGHDITTILAFATKPDPFIHSILDRPYTLYLLPSSPRNLFFRKNRPVIASPDIGLSYSIR